MLEGGSAAMPAHRLAQSAYPAPLVFIFLLLVGRIGLFPLFAASCPLGSDHCSFSHQILEFNPNQTRRGQKRGKITNAFHILTYSGFHGFVFGFSLLPHGKSAAVCLRSSYSIQVMQTVLSAPQFIRHAKEGLIFLVTAWQSHCPAVEILFGCFFVFFKS